MPDRPRFPLLLRSMLHSCRAALWLMALGTATAGPLPQKLWAGTPPGEIPATKPNANPQGEPIDALRVTDVAEPTLTRYNPEKPDGRALIVCPGGAYSRLSIEKDGERVAHRFIPTGITVFVLRYRVPVNDYLSAGSAPRLDLAESLRQVRISMHDQGFEKPLIGVMGFSAGGHLVLESAYGEMPAGAPRPDFVVAVYPAYLVKKPTDPGAPGQLIEAFHFTKDSPPACFIHAADDTCLPEGSVQVWRQLNAVGVKAELHLYAQGGHGFGISDETKNLPVHQWPDNVEAWMGTLKQP